MDATKRMVTSRQVEERRRGRLPVWASGDFSLLLWFLRSVKSLQGKWEHSVKNGGWCCTTIFIWEGKQQTGNLWGILGSWFPVGFWAGSRILMKYHALVANSFWHRGRKVNQLVETYCHFDCLKSKKFTHSLSPFEL